MAIIGSKRRQIEIKLYYEERETESEYVKIVILEDEVGKTRVKEQEEKNKIKIAAGEKLLPEDEKTKILTTYWQPLMWGEQQEITKMCEKYSPDGMQDVDVFAFRDLRLKKCLIDWDIKDEKGSKIRISPDNIDLLPTEVVFALVNKFDLLTRVNEEDERKNS